jgi:hypothetical protein
MKRLIILCSLVVVLFISQVDAHPGNTDGNGGHTCRTNCPSWGLSYGEYHYHNAKTYTTPSYTSTYAAPTYNAPTTPSCPLMSSYNSSTDSCQCNSGYIVSGSSCVSATLYCSNKIGLMSDYNSITKSCECMAGYEYNGSSCVYKSKYSKPTSTYAPMNSCPPNSQSSTSDSTKCSCNAGYENNSTNDGCVITPVKTFDQMCKDDFGNNSVWNLETDEKKLPLCVCVSGYEWSIDRKSCIQSAPPAIVVQKKSPDTVQSNKNFTVPASDIQSLKIVGTLKKPSTFRQCPSTQCSVIKYYAENSKLNITGKYKKGSWYQVSGTTDAAGGNGKKVVGWIAASLFEIK